MFPESGTSTRTFARMPALSVKELLLMVNVAPPVFDKVSEFTELPIVSELSV
jgi:hypothetical protein